MITIFPEAKLLKPTTVLLYAYLTNAKWAINHASNHAKHHKTLTLRNCHSGSEKVTNRHGGALFVHITEQWAEWSRMAGCGVRQNDLVTVEWAWDSLP